MKRRSFIFIGLLAAWLLVEVSERKAFPQTSMTDALGHTTTSVYDAANRVKEVDYPTATGTVGRYTYYDGLGRKIQENDEAGVATAYTYDFRGLLTSVTLAFGTTQAVTTVYAYDELGNLIRQTDAAGHSTTFQYDALGRRTGRTLPGNQHEGYAYHPYTGNLLYQTNFNGVILTNQYDVANRLTNVSSVNYRTSYGYSATGLRTNLTDASGTTVYRYDALNELTNKVVTWSGGPTLALNYGYDALGTLTNLWSGTAGGVSNGYAYDVLGRLTNVLANGSNAAGYGFDAVGNLQGLRYGNGVTNQYQYDVRNRLTNLVWNLNAGTLANFGYTVGVTGNRLSSTETINSQPSTINRSYQWAYDYLYRMTGETMSGLGVVNYGFDAVGNRTNRTSTVTGITNQLPTFNANDWLLSDKYDNNGNTTNSANIAYQYDVLNHLTNANNGAILLTYDGDGNRVSKKVGSTTTYYLVDDRNPSGYAQVLEEWTSTGTPALSRVYNYGLALISQRQVGGTVSYYGTDGHGSTRFLLNTSGSITDAYTFDAYGLVVSQTPNPGSQTLNNYLYCGQQFDSDLGMYHLRARYYKPDSGRFWTMDSFEGNNEDPLSLHKYLYAQDNPIMRTDPDGKSSMLVITDSSNPAAYDKQVADIVAGHFQTAGWTINFLDVANFVGDNKLPQFDGLILSGHGDEDQAAGIGFDTLASVLKRTTPKLDVCIALSCHGFDFTSRVSRAGFTSPTALVMGYWGYSLNFDPDKWIAMGMSVDAWLKKPIYTSVFVGNLVEDGGGQIVYGIAVPAYKTVSDIINTSITIDASWF